MANKVVDSGAVLVFLQDGKGASLIEEAIEHAARDKHRLFMSVISWSELYGRIGMVSPDADLIAVMQSLSALPIQIVPISEDLLLAHIAAVLRAKYDLTLELSYAAAVAKERKAELITVDEGARKLIEEIKVNLIGNSKGQL